MKCSISNGIKFLLLALYVIAVFVVSIQLFRYNNNLVIAQDAVTTSSKNTDVVVDLKYSIDSIITTNNISKSISDVCDIAKSSNTYIYLTDEEIRDFATLVYLEGGNQSYECQLAIASVIVNRMTTSNSSLYDVMYAKNQFTPANRIKQHSPSESTLNAVKEVITYGPTIPEHVIFFRADYYHNWGSWVEPYIVYDNTYFSSDLRLVGED